MDREQEIRSIAYRIWEYEGHPDGRDMEHWLKAEAMFREQERRESEPSRQASPDAEQRPRRRSSGVLGLM